MPEAVIVDAVRTPIGRAVKGSLKDVRADDLAAVPLKALQERNPDVDFAETADVMMGAAFGAGEQGYNIGRNAALLADIDHHVPACTLNRFCASSLQTLRMAFHAIKVGEGDQYIAAGVEAVSRAAGAPDFEFHKKLDGGPDSVYNVYIPMGLTAENVADRCKVTREQQDEWAVVSQNRAVDAQASGHFDKEIVPVTTPDGTEVSKDDGPRPSSTLEKLAELPEAFEGGGGVTAGNSCPLNDGAAAVLLMSDTKARELGITPRARIVTAATYGNEPEYMGVAPIGAIKKVLDRAGMAIGDVDVVELNEAFAAQVIPIMDQCDIPLEKLNTHGGAIALGHPFGMTGARIMTTLLNAMETDDHQVGLETMCVAGGQGKAMIVERLS